MKFFIFFVGVLVLALGCVPCADDALSSRAEYMQKEFSASHSHDGTQHKDTCSPFCHCACCAGFSIYYNVSCDINPEITLGNLFVSYLPANLTQISLPIWQPPQLLS